MRRPTLRDVADRAGVHPGTASRALNPALPGRTAPATTERVERAARELGYVVDRTARSLRTSRSGFVGVVVPDLTNPVIPPIVRGIEAILWTAGLACLLADTDNDPERETVLVDELRSRRCEGLIVSTAARDSRTVAALAREELPTVLVTRDIDHGSLPLVAGDDDAGVRQAVAHLAGLGHRRIAHVTGPTALSTTAVRERAFADSVAGRGLQRGASVHHGEAFTVPAGRAATQRLLAERDDVTAILAGNDMIAVGALEALAEAGLGCPADVSLVGHNDMPLMAHLQPPLTTVSISQYDLGTRAAQLLLERIAGTATGDTPRMLLPTTLVVRGSTAPPRRRP